MPVHQPFIATVIAPSNVVAQNVIAYSAQFAAAIATRSPLPTPYRSLSVRATAAAADGHLRVADRAFGKRDVRPIAEALGRSEQHLAQVDRGRFLKTCIGTPSTSSTTSSNGAPGPASPSNTARGSV